MSIEELGQSIIGAAIEVHRELGPGLLESSYEACLLHELNLRRIQAASQVPMPVCYKGLELEAGYRIDILVENCLVLELRTVAELTDLHMAQILTYMRLSNCHLGFLLNFNVPIMKRGIRRVVHGLDA